MSFLDFFSLGAKDDKELGSRLVVIFCCFASIAEDDNELQGSLSFYTFFLVVEDDDYESGGSWLVIVS